MSKTQHVTARSAKSDIRLVCLLVVAVVTAYSNSFSGVFLLDDTRAIVENARIRQLWPLGEILSGPRPVVDVTLAVNHAISGERPWSYHLVNLVVHVFAAMALFGLVRQVLERRAHPHATGVALAAALLWGVHPLNTQAVTYVIQRSESMMGLFYLLTLYCVVRSADAKSPRGWQAGAVIFCALGMGTKAVIVTLPVVAALLDRAFLSTSWREVLRRRWGLYLALVATWSVLFMTGVMGGLVETSAGAHSTVGLGVKRATPIEYAMTEAGVVLRYLKLAFWPSPLCFDYVLPVVRQFSEAALPLVGVLLLLAGSIWVFRRNATVGFFGVAFFMLLAPTSSFVPIQDVAAEHRMYLPLATIVVLAVAAVCRVVRRVEPCAMLLGLAALVLGAGTYQRNKVYASGILMWQDVVEQSPRNGRAHNNLGNALLAANRPKEAMSHFETALQLVEPNPKTMCNYADALAAMNRTAEATAQYRRALELFPENAVTLNKLGMMLAKQREYDQAIAYFESALRVDPALAEAHFNLGLALSIQGRLAESIDHYRKALVIRPDVAEWHNNLAVALSQDQKFDEAAKEFMETLRIEPRHFMAHFNLGSLYESGGEFGKAAREYEVALTIKPDYTSAQRRLQVVLARMGATTQDASPGK